MTSNLDCAICDSVGEGRLATHRVVVGSLTMYLCRDHAERYAGDAGLRRWEAAPH